MPFISLCVTNLLTDTHNGQNNRNVLLDCVPNQYYPNMYHYIHRDNNPIIPVIPVTVITVMQTAAYIIAHL